MNRFAKLSLAAAALSLTALSAMPASAADIVVSLKGKSTQEALVEIKAAAATVCREDGRFPLGELKACTDGLVQDTLKQLPASFGK